MKRAVVGGLFLALIFTGSGWASTVSPEEAREAHRNQMRKIKAEQRTAREAARNNPQAAADKAPGFWEREGERSGLGMSGERAKGFFKNLNPVRFFKEQEEKYEARKTGQASPAIQ